MIEYYSVAEYNSLKDNAQIKEDIYKEASCIWNEDCGFIFPITDRVMDQNIRHHSGFLANASFLAFSEKTLVGFMFCKYHPNPMVPKWSVKAYISLFYVKRSFRKQGIGSELLKRCEEELYKLPIETISVGAEIENFFPGVPTEFDNRTDTFLANRGYSVRSITHDLIGFTKDIDYFKRHTDEKRFTWALANQNDIEAVRAFFKKNFPGRWEYEYEEYLAQKGHGQDYLIIKDNENKGIVCAFVRVNDRTSPILPYNVTYYDRFSNLGGIGPLGVDKDYRKMGLGYDIVALGMNELKRRGMDEIIIDWTGIMEFYRQFHCEVWKTYRYVDKEIVR